MPKITYETAIKQLEAIVTQLENGSLTLDESVKLYEKGMKLSAFCAKALNEAELKLMTIDEAEESEDE